MSNKNTNENLQPTIQYATVPIDYHSCAIVHSSLNFYMLRMKIEKENKISGYITRVFESWRTKKLNL